MSLTQVDTHSSNDIVTALAAQDANTPAAPLREDARRALEQLNLPGNKHEEYRHTPLTRALRKNFDLAATRNYSTTFTGNEGDYAIAGLDSHRIVMVNGVFNKALSAYTATPGVTISSLEEALEKTPQKVLEYLAKIAGHKQDAFTAWNTAAWKSGVFIAVDDKVVLDKPIIIHYLADAAGEPVTAFTRNLFVVGTSSEATILCKFDSAGTNSHFTSLVTEGVVKANGSLTLYNLQADKGQQYQFNQTSIHQANASRVNSFTFTLDGKMIRNNLQLQLDGEGCESHMYGLYLLQGDTFADNHTVVDHQKPHSFSNELYKGVMNDKAKGIFNGKIYVRPNAQKTNAFQSNRNILLSDNATVNTKPQLEIWADDVKCSHGCTTGQLDEEALFYLRARGIGKEAAQAMLLYAFAGEVLDKVGLPQVKEYLDKTIGARLYKTN